MFCPACNGHLIYAGTVPVSLPRLRVSRISDVLTCTRCPATTEYDKVAGRLIDYPDIRPHRLFWAYPSARCRETFVSLRGGSPTFRGDS